MSYASNLAAHTEYARLLRHLFGLVLEDVMEVLLVSHVRDRTTRPNDQKRSPCAGAVCRLPPVQLLRRSLTCRAPWSPS